MRDILVGIEPDLDLDARVAGLDIAARLLRHARGLGLRHRAVERDGLAEAAAQHLRQRLLRILADEVPARHVDRGLGVGVALQHMVHAPVERDGLQRVFPDQRRRQLGQRRPRTGSKRRIVERTERRHLAPPHKPGIGVDAHDGGLESQRAAPAGAGVGAVAERLVLAVGRDLGDAHEVPPFS